MAPGLEERLRRLSRRDTILAGLALLAVGGCSGCSARAVGGDGIPLRQLGAITANSLADMRRFANWLGRHQDHELLYFNQESWAGLEQSVSFIVGLGASVLAQGRPVHWSIPAGGPAAYADISSGRWDKLYETIGHGIAAIYGASRQRICVRLFWEFNMPAQTLAARNAGGIWEPAVYVSAYRRVASILRKISDRFYFDWCPNIGTGGVAPDLCYPGDDVVEIVSMDVYYRSIYDRQHHRDGGDAIFHYRRGEPFGLDWLADFASRKGKLVGISEWGVDDDEAVVFMQRMCEWIVSLGDTLSHHNYWDRADGGVVSQLSTGHLPAIGAIYRSHFGPRV